MKQSTPTILLRSVQRSPRQLTWFDNQLELAVQHNLTAPLKHKGFLKNDSKTLNTRLTSESLFTADLILLRVSTVLALTFSVKQPIINIYASMGDLPAKNSEVKLVVDRLLIAAHRLFKLNKFEHLTQPGLGDDGRVYELNGVTLRHLDLLLRVNLASALILKTFSSEMTPDKFLFLSSVCKVTLDNISQLRLYFNVNFSRTVTNLASFLDIAHSFYRCLMIFVVIRINIYEDKGLIKRTKDFKVNYVENMVLAKEFRLLVELLRTRKTDGSDTFNVRANCKAAVDFLNRFASEDVDQ